MLRQTTVAVAFGLLTSTLGLVPRARAQAIAFEPVIGQALTGSTLGVTPVVSPDRRYVRLSVGASFNNVNGFTNFSIPAAVSGGGSGNFNAGMNGVIGPVGVDVGSGSNPYGFAGDVGQTRAGPLPMNMGLGAGNSLAQSDGLMGEPAFAMNGWPEDSFDESQPWPSGVANRSVASGGQRGIRSAKAVSRQRRAARKAAATQPKTTPPSVRRAR
jgi:hypothetical protein